MCNHGHGGVINNMVKAFLFWGVLKFRLLLRFHVYGPVGHAV
jgi:hypothetical protein